MMRIGTIGSGPIVELFLDAVRQVDGVECTAVYSRQEDKARKLAALFNVRRTHTSLLDLFQDDQVDFVYIASPNSLHFEQASQAMASGKHVILEKPLTSTADEAFRLIEQAREQRRFLFEAITTLHFPNFQQARALLPQLGPIRLVQCSYAQYSSRYDKLMAGEVPNVFNPAFSGGCLYDLNIYNIHFVEGLFGSAKSVCYRANLAENGIDTSGIALLAYDGFVASCAGAKDSESPSFCLIQGSKGYIRFASPANVCSGFEFSVDGQAEWIDFQEESNRMVYELKSFADCHGRKDHAMAMSWLTHSLSVMRTAEAARKDAGIVFAAD